MTPYGKGIPHAADANRRGSELMNVIIDRFEGGFAVVELPDKTTANIPRDLLPDASEGDVVTISVNRAATEERRQRIKALSDRLRRK